MCPPFRNMWCLCATPKGDKLLLIANIVTTSKALVTRSDALIPSSEALVTTCLFFFVQSRQSDSPGIDENQQPLLCTTGSIDAQATEQGGKETNEIANETSESSNDQSHAKNKKEATSNKCIATSNKCLATSNKCIAIRNKCLTSSNHDQNLVSLNKLGGFCLLKVVGHGEKKFAIE